jgi:hypothetical protein
METGLKYCNHPFILGYGVHLVENSVNLKVYGKYYLVSALRSTANPKSFNRYALLSGMWCMSWDNFRRQSFEESFIIRNWYTRVAAPLQVASKCVVRLFISEYESLTDAAHCLGSACVGCLVESTSVAFLKEFSIKRPRGNYEYINKRNV